MNDDDDNDNDNDNDNDVCGSLRRRLRTKPTLQEKQSGTARERAETRETDKKGYYWM
jgi:hypothetical protein